MVCDGAGLAFQLAHHLAAQNIVDPRLTAAVPANGFGFRHHLAATARAPDQLRLSAGAWSRSSEWGGALGGIATAKLGVKLRLRN
jgi:hypothetical protein